MSEVDLAPGATLSRYEIVAPFRAAGAGSSYRAIDQQTSRPVIVRALPPLDGRDRETFELDASRLVKLRHPGIVSLLDYGVDNTVPFLVTEFVEGESLATMLSRGDLRPADSLSILRQAAAAIDYAHAAGVVHGDLQLQGVLIDRTLHPHIPDFGLGSLTGSAGEPPSDGAAYRAPEQVRSGQAGAAADRYSFAAIASVLVEHAAGSDSAAANAVDAVIAKGLDHDPNRRWPSCTALVDALDRALVAPGVPAAQKNRAGIWIALAAAAGIAVLAVLLLVNRPAATPTAAPPNAAISLSRSTVIQGATVVVNGTHLPANQAGTVQLQSRPQQVGTFTADPSGSFSVSVTVPESTSKGDHVISACWDNGCPLQSTLTVLATPPSPSPSPSASPSPSPSTSPTSTASSPSPTASASH